MRAFWSDPYLWIHASGLAVVPICLILCLLGLAIGDPTLPVGLELGLVAFVGIVPIAWMQWKKPFYIFSLVAVAIKPEKLTEDQRRLLTLFKTRANPVWIGLGSVLLILLLRQIYFVAPIAANLLPFPEWRGLGLLVAAIGFLASNLFLQVPLSVAQVLLTSDAQFGATEPYGLTQIPQNFSVFGLRVNQIVPALVADREVSDQSLTNAPLSESVSPLPEDLPNPDVTTSE
ncbi:low-complexity tail membrane protein [Phormidesmis priestleyi]